MDSNNRYFYISGLLSFSLFIIFLSAFFLLLFKPLENKSYALKKDTYISISLELPQMAPLKTEKKANETLKEKVIDTVEKKADINELFSDVWTKKIIHKKEKKQLDKRKYLALQKKIKTTQVNRVKSIAKELNNLDKIEAHKKKGGSSTAQEVNEYLAKIQAIVYQYFHVPPNSEGNSVKAVIELNAFGKVKDFRILTYSNSIALNEEADKMKNRLLHVNFPVNPENKSSRTIILLISEE